jgi:hypothetical protein
VYAIALLVTGVTFGEDQRAPFSSRHLVSGITTVDVRGLQPILPSQLLAEDAAKSDLGPAPQRFAVPEAVMITPQTDGTWEPLDNGGRLWRLRFDSPNATDLNFGFTRFRMPRGATLHLLSEQHEIIQGPYGADHNRDHGELWTPVIPGERAVLELYVPPSPEFEPELELGQVGRGYRDLFKTAQTKGKQGSCNVDTACQEGDSWRREIRSVAVFSIHGSMACSGTLIMDVPRSFRPFFLIAAHCGVSENTDQSVVTYWNFQSPECGQLGGGALNQTVSGSTLLARRSDVDFALLELDETPSPEYDPQWSGWDRRADRLPEGSVCIHHPNADEKAISINEDSLSISSSCIASTGPDTHWTVDNWEIGTTEVGSSGGGLWDPATHLLIGFLSGGIASCGNPAGYDCFGRFATAWDGPTSGERLRDWLDPENTGAEIVFGGKSIKPPRMPRPRPDRRRLFPVSRMR